MKYSIGLVLFSSLVMALPLAQANPDLARSWSEEASLLEARINTSPEGNLSEDLKSDIQRFGRIAGRLANSGSEANPLPHDLGCIFRGMKEETDIQLSHLSPEASTEDISNARTRLVKMFDDAADVGQAAAIALEAGVALDQAETTSDEPAQCPADWSAS